MLCRRFCRDEGRRHEHVISEWAEGTTMSMLGPVTRSDRYRSGISATPTRLLVDDDADAACQRDGDARVGDED